MDAFSALSANLVPTTTPPPPAGTSSSASTDTTFASHLQSATKQHRAGQRSETTAKQAEGQPQQGAAEQATDPLANEPSTSQAESTDRAPGQGETDATKQHHRAGQRSKTVAPQAAESQPQQVDAGQMMNPLANELSTSQAESTDRAPGQGETDAIKQHQAGQPSETVAPQAESQAQQAAAEQVMNPLLANEPLISQAEPTNRKEGHVEVGATQQYWGGQHSEISAPHAEGQTQNATREQATDPLANELFTSQTESANRKPGLSAQTEATATAGGAPTTANASAMTRLLDAITATAPRAGSDQQEQAATASTSLPPPKNTAAAVAPAQQIIVESVASFPAASPLSSSLTVTTAPLSTSAPTTEQPSTASTPLQAQPTAAQHNLAAQTPSFVAEVIDAQNAATAAGGETSLPQSDSEPSAPLVVQNQYGQIITIQQNTAAALPVATQPQTAAQGTPLASNGQADMDLTNQYIHSHLPNDTAAKGENTENRSAMNNESGQSTPQNQSSQQADPPGFVEPLFTAKTLAATGQESQPLIFSHQQSSNLTSAPLTTSTTADSTLHRLPSGTTVPETTVIDQMITHFSINKRLESGTVNLRLSPQELGELRMEIKIEQDNVKAHIITQSPHAQEMIDRHLPKLREALEQQGLHLNQVEVTVAANDNAAGEAFQESASWQQSQRSMDSKQSQANFTMEGLDEELDPTAEADNNLSVIA